MKKLILIATVILSSSFAVADSVRPPSDCATEGLETVVNCTSVSKKVSIQNVLVCTDGTESTMQINQPNGVGSAPFPVGVEVRAGATTYRSDSGALNLTLTVGSRPLRQNGRIVRSAKLLVETDDRSGTIKMTCTR